MMTMLAAYQERKLYHECSVRAMQELASEKRFSWRKVRKAIALAALLGAESQLCCAVFQSLEAD